MDQFRWINILKYLALILIAEFIYPVFLLADNFDLATKYFYNDENYTMALEHYLAAQKENPENSELLYRTGLCYYLLGNNDDSLRFWGLAKKQNPKIFSGKIQMISSNAMAPTLIKGDHVIVDNSYFEYKKARRGDVIVFKYPNDPKKKLIKRIIGLPKENFEIINKIVYIDGKKLDEPYAVFKDPTIIPKGKNPRDNYGPFRILRNSYFVMGDNRDISFDSRRGWLLSKDFLIGKALVIYFSASPASLDNANKKRIGRIIK